MNKYSDLIDRFFERSDVKLGSRDLLENLCATNAMAFALDLEESMNALEPHYASSCMVVTGLLLTQIGIDQCLEDWGLQGPDEDILREEDRVRLARYVLVQTFKNLSKSIERNEDESET